MPMGNVKGKTNCQACIDCEPMISSEGRSYRCYGENREMGAPLKRDFAEGKDVPPRIAPKWCPHRKRNSV